VRRQEVFLSESDEIQEVFEQDIANKTRQVSNKFGSSPFYDYFSGLQIKRILDGVISSEDEDMIERLYNSMQEGEDDG
jgi:hypothetical protein